MVSFSIIIVTHDREKLLSKCLESLISKDIDFELILVANGKDLSQEILEKALMVSKNLKVIKNDHQFMPGLARNEALKFSSRDWVFFVDDDAYLLPGYWEIIIPLLADPKIEIIGGPDRPAEGMNTTGEALALSLTSPFCSGSTFVRHKPVGKKIIEASEEKLTSCNLWIRKSLLEITKFPEDFKRAEETVLLQKLHLQGKKMYYHPGLRVAHFRRQKITEILRPSFFAGIYRSKVMKLNPKNSNSLFWLPSIFVLLHGIYFVDSLTFWYLARMYISLILFMSIAIASKEKKLSLFPLITFFHYLIVFSFGLGFLFERLGIKNGTK